MISSWVSFVWLILLENILIPFLKAVDIQYFIHWNVLCVSFKQFLEFLNKKVKCNVKKQQQQQKEYYGIYVCEWFELSSCFYLLSSSSCSSL